MGLKVASSSIHLDVAIQLTREVSLCFLHKFFAILLPASLKERLAYLLLLSSARLLQPQSTMPFKVAIVADSRGGFLQYFLNLHNENQHVTYTTSVYKGRRIEELWHQARARLSSGECDHVYMLGGICNLTSAYFYNGIRTFWPLKNVEDLTYDLIHTTNIVANEALFLGYRGKLTFLPETGADLLAYNHVEHQAQWMIQCQTDLNNNIFFLYEGIKNINSRLGCITPWSFDCIYGRNRHGFLYPKFNKLYDGLHPTPSTAADMARKIIKDVNHVLQWQG